MLCDFLFAHKLSLWESNPCICVQGSASVVSAASTVLLSSMTTEAVCERVRQIEGIDQSMMGQYSATIRKVGGTASHSTPRAPSTGRT